MEKIVGLLSMHRVPNYGSFLQAYALKQLLLQNGADDVFFIDIERGRQLEGHKSSSFFTRFRKLFTYILTGKILKRLHYGRYIEDVSNSIYKQQDKYLGLNRISPNHFDLAVIGSDEVFHCCQVSSWGYTLQLFGKIANASKVISYAGSFGHTSLQKLKKLGIDKEIGDTMKTMSAISVRDTNSFNIVKSITGIEPNINLDPVLMYDYSSIIDKYDSFTQDPYMVVYTYADRIKDNEEISQIVDFAQAHKLKIVAIFCNYDWADEIVIPETPFDVLGWFKGAEYVVTDTFHGTIFSIITRSKFCTLVRENNVEKLTSLLSKLGLQNQANKNIAKVLHTTIDYEYTSKIIDKERAKTNAYLQDALNLK